MHTTHVDIENLKLTAPAELEKYKRRAIGIAGIFGIASIICFIFDTRQAMQAYLVGYMLFIGFTLGSMGWLMLWHVVGGRWGLSMRRIWEAGMSNIWAAVIAFIPILIGYKLLFPWANPNAHYEGHLKYLTHNFLNFPLFTARAVIYFAVWILMISALNRWSRIQDKPYDTWLGRKFNVLSGPGMVIYFWTMTFAIIDWIMSLTPGWPSTVFALIVIIGQGLLAMGLALIMGSILVKHEPMNQLMDEVVFWDNGKLLLAFVMLWAYLSFSQWLIIWAGNLPEEIKWYLQRTRHGWEVVALFLVFFHFAVPFAILLSQKLKKIPSKIAAVGAWMIFMRLVDLFWMTAPSWSPEHINPGVWMYAVVPVALVAIWVVLFLRNYVNRPIIALYDPRVVEIYGEAHE